MIWYVTVYMSILNFTQSKYISDVTGVILSGIFFILILRQFVSAFIRCICTNGEWGGIYTLVAEEADKSYPKPKMTQFTITSNIFWKWIA